MLRRHAPAIAWFDALDEEEELAISGYVAMEVIQGCRNKAEQERIWRQLSACGIVWLSPRDCDDALEVFAAYRLSHGAGLLDVLIGQTAVMLDVPLHTFNEKHYHFHPQIRTAQPYSKEV